MSERNDHSQRSELFSLLRGVGKQTTYRPGRRLFAQGERCDFALIIERGKVNIERRTANGNTTLVAIRGAGNLIGEFGCIDRAPRSASATAATHVTAFVIPAADLRRILKAQSSILFTLLATTIRRVRESDRLLLDFGAESKVERVVRKLLTLAEQSQEPHATDEGSVRLDITQDDLARAASVSRSTVTRACELLRKRGLISTGHGIVIPDLELLRAFVSGERA